MDENGQYSDPVIDLLQDVMKKLYEPYSELIGLADRMSHISEAQKREKILKAMITKMF